MLFSYQLPYLDPHHLLKKVPYLDDAVIYYQGNINAEIGEATNYAILAYNPSIKRKLRLDELKSFKSIKTINESKQSHHFIAGWAIALPYSCGADYYLKASSDYIYANYYDYSLYLDLSKNRIFINSYTKLSLEKQQQIAHSISELDNKPNFPIIKPDWQPIWSKEEYLTAFKRVKQYLTSGDTYQVNLAYPFYCSDDLTQQSPYALFEHFQAPFCGYFSITDEKRTLFSVSPERLVSLKYGEVEAKPIKGTLPRGGSPQEDKNLIKQLSQCPKNRSENLMIVDLLRNDLSDTAQLHSVKVEPIFAVESYKNVHHLVSTVKSKLKPNKTSYELLHDVFPGGSITGAPKKRAIEIIGELETRPRGFYCGSLGYIDDAGHADFNILIRSIESTPKGSYCWGGGGIVIESDGLDEYQEIQHKIRSLLVLAF